MAKNTYIGIGVGVVVSVLIVGGSFWYVVSKNDKQPSSQATKTLGSSTGSNNVSLNNPGSSTGGLSVEQDAFAVSLGQLDGNPNQQTNSGDSSTKKANPFDPSTFAQYEKYKDGTSGLFAEVQKGTGKEIADNKKAAVYYRGWLTNGQLFDESKRDEKGQLQPFVFTQGAHQVIPGWEQALAGMKVGGVRLLIVPPAAGYGTAGQSPIPPNAVLVFQVQLIEVQ